MENRNLHVISGGPGSGKTTLIEELAKLGFRHAPEVARQIIQQQVAAGGAALPWQDREAYTKLMLDHSIASYQENFASSNITFFDRGIPDTLCYARLIGLPETSTIENACHEFRYAPVVFLAPPWKEIYTTDHERKQDFEEAQPTYEEMVRVYQDCGYAISFLPQLAPEARAEYVLKQINRVQRDRG